jgi:hypothetical protein
LKRVALRDDPPALALRGIANRAASRGGEATYAYTTTGVLMRLGACPTDDAAGRAVGTHAGARAGDYLGEEVEVGAAEPGGDPA